MIVNPFTGEAVELRADMRERKRAQRGGLHPRAVNIEGRRAHERARADRIRLARPIVAWDGEGTAVPDGVPQPYVLLKHSGGGRLFDAKGLRTETVLRYLVDAAHDAGDARHVAFGLSYDVNQWLRELPADKLSELHQRGRCWWRDWRIEYRPRRTFAVRNVASGRGIMLWDVQTWFGTSLPDAMRFWLPDDPRTEPIAAMKARRRAFTVGELPTVEAYCDLELSATVDLTRALLTSLTAVGLRPSRIDGPGGAASRLLQDYGVKTHLPVALPHALERAAMGAYSGGRIEPLQFGAGGAAYEYDLHSAYPWAMTQLPSLAGGRWRYHAGAEQPVEDWCCYRVRWTQTRAHGVGTSRLYPFPWRDRTGGMYYPSAGEAWVWGPEWRAYLDTRALYDCDVEVIGAWRFVPADADARPFAFLRDLYAVRRAAGPREAAVLKSAMAAVYGKLVQAVGWRDEPPPYYCIVWGGLVTSYVRARLLRFAARDPEAVVMFATDGVFTTRKVRLPRAEEGDGMGQWSAERVDALTVIQSGVYLVERDGAVEAMTRGYSPRELGSTPTVAAAELHQRVLAGWAAGAESVHMPQQRFISLATWDEIAPGPPAWRSWVTDDRELMLWPQGKRTGGDGDPTRGLVCSLPTPVIESLGERPVMSTAYARTWRPSPASLLEGVSPLVYEEEIEEAVL